MKDSLFLHAFDCTIIYSGNISSRYYSQLIVTHISFFKLIPVRFWEHQRSISTISLTALPNMFKKTLQSVPAPVFLAVRTCTGYTSTKKITISSQSNTVSCWWQNNLIQFKYIPCWGWTPSPKAGSSLTILRSSSFSESQRPHLNENFAPVLVSSTWI